MAGSGGQEDKRAAIKEAKRALDEAQKAYKRRVKDARDELSGAEQARERELSGARRELQDAQKAYDKRVAAASNRRAKARKGELLGSHGDVQLYDNRLESPEGEVPLSTDIKASVESSGELTSKSDSRAVSHARYADVPDGHQLQAGRYREGARTRCGHQHGRQERRGADT